MSDSGEPVGSTRANMRSRSQRGITMFRLVGIDHQQFEPLFALSDDALRQHDAVRRVANTSPGFPCRISLEDAGLGDELLLLTYPHQPAASPYRSSGPIYIRRGAQQRTLAAGVVPDYVTSRLISVRAYDAQHLIAAASVCEGPFVAQEIERFFADGEIAYIHLHNAKRGCFSCLVERI
jgi:hypothetical protein